MEVTVNCTKVEVTPTRNGGSYLKITDENGKFHNIMPKTPGYNLVAQGKKVKLIKEQKGEFMNVVKVEDVNTPDAPASSPQPQERPVNRQEDNKVKCVAFSYSKDLVIAHIIGIEDIYNAASDIEKYLTGQFTPAHKSDWLIKYIDKAK